MEYNVKINIADSFDILSEAEEGMPLVSNVRLKDATSLSENITLGTAVSKQLTFTLYNSPVEIYDGQKVTLYIDPVEEEAEIDLTEYELTDEEVLNDLFEVQEDLDGGNEFTVAQASALATEMAAIGTEHDYDLYPNEEEGELDDDDENPSNDVYRDDGVGELEDEPGEEEDFVMMGEFYITKIISKDDIYEITALDGFILMNGKYVPTNNVDTVENMYADFIAQMDTTLGLEVYSEPEYPELTIIWDYDTTYREAAGYFAGLMGGYATFDRNGAMDIRQYMQNEVPIDEIISMDINSDGAVTISGMRCDTDITALENWIQTEEDIPGFSIDFVNPFMTQSILNNIYTTYYEYLEYVPAKLTVDWYDRIQAGDLIKVEDNWILITNQTINFASGTSVIDSLGTTATLSEGQITDPMVRKMQRTQSNLKTSVQIAQELAQEADLMATATNQHFWNSTDGIYYLSADTTVDTSKEYFSKSGDTYTRVTPTGNENPVTQGWYERLGAGAYVTEIPQEEFNDPENPNYHSGKNSLWNSLGMVFRSGLRYLLTILTGDTTGVAIYDGQGNSDENIVASFTDSGSVIGKYSGSRTIIQEDNITMVDANGSTNLIVESSGVVSDVPYRDWIHSYFPLGIDTEETLNIFRAFRKPPNGTVIQLEIKKQSSNNPIILFFTVGTSGTETASDDGATCSVSFDGDKIVTFIPSSGSKWYPQWATWTAHEIAPCYTFGNRSTTDEHGDPITDADGGYSMTIGRELVSTSPYWDGALVVGQYNTLEHADNLFVVGNGGGKATRNDAFRVDAQGHAYAKNLTGSQTENYVSSGRFGNLQILSGYETINVTSSGTNFDQPVSYGITFKYNPNVQLTMLNIGGSYYQKCTVASPTTTGFTIRIRAGNAPGNITVNWMAIGERA